MIDRVYDLLVINAPLSDENDRLKKSLADIRLVNRAKCLLIEKLGLTEEEAHKEMEKQAMNRRMEKVELAKKIIEKYED